MHDPPPKLGKTWGILIYQTPPSEYNGSKKTPEEPNWIYAEDIGVIWDFYSKLESAMKINNIQLKSIHNADETGFQIG